jgi:hypothetical protein
MEKGYGQALQCQECTCQRGLRLSALLPRNVLGRTALLVGEIRWLPNPDGRLANAIGLADSSIRFPDPDSGLTNIHIRLPDPDSRLSNAVGLADRHVRLTDSDGASANAHVRLTNSNGALSDAIGLADPDSRLSNAGIRPASQTR